VQTGARVRGRRSLALSALGYAAARACTRIRGLCSRACTGGATRANGSMPRAKPFQQRPDLANLDPSRGPRTAALYEHPSTMSTHEDEGFPLQPVGVWVADVGTPSGSAATAVATTMHRARQPTGSEPLVVISPESLDHAGHPHRTRVSRLAAYLGHPTQCSTGGRT
jgi:hypothetical protein